MTPNPNVPPSPSSQSAEQDELINASQANNGDASVERSPIPSVTPTSNGRMPDTRFTQDFYRELNAVPSTPSIWVLLLVLAIAISLAGAFINLPWVANMASIVVLILAGRVFWLTLRPIVAELLSPRQQANIVAMIGVVTSVVLLVRYTGLGPWFGEWYSGLNWDAVGATGEVVGALGQILIAVLAVYVAWRQYVISRDLTIQQNLITQQQTIDSYFQGISELVLDAEGLLEDWPQERAIAEGRTAAILSSVDNTGKAKVVRFLSRSRLLSPLKRDRILGRAILDGTGGYEEDRENGVRVIDLGVMMAGADLSQTDLRWTDLSDANLIRARLRNCDLVKTNFVRTILAEADLSGSDVFGAKFFHGSAKTASPRSRTILPNYKTGEHTGAVIENANFAGVQRMTDEQRYYCCAWGGSKTRSTVPGGCEGIPNLLGR
ncbi:pentapeptide repeat-containing protein [Leptolyngbya sp. AN02str]|uniref:pentapeptide repeat-containing protein n=1 Tax=Leptolyngbya sp. AN02str TaxID=3423363 RepID=UPI003D3135A3